MNTYGSLFVLVPPSEIRTVDPHRQLSGESADLHSSSECQVIHATNFADLLSKHLGA
jgi:hypothetical protein